MHKILVLMVAGLSLVTCGGDGGGASGTCQQIGTTICQKACSCREGPTCAMSQGGGLTLDFPEIAARLFISRNTVKTEAVSIYRKLTASSRSEAIERAVEVGLLESSLYPPRANLTQ